MAQRHIRVRLPQDMLLAMERVLADRPNLTIDDIVEAAVAMWLRASEDQRIDAAIAAGYLRHPAGEFETEMSRISAATQRRLEPW